MYHVMAMAMGRQWQWQWVGNGEAMTRGIAGNGIARYWQCQCNMKPLPVAAFVPREPPCVSAQYNI
jgi:hypothetical protein